MVVMDAVAKKQIANTHFNLQANNDIKIEMR